MTANKAALLDASPKRHAQRNTSAQPAQVEGARPGWPMPCASNADAATKQWLLHGLQQHSVNPHIRCRSGAGLHLLRLHLQKRSRRSVMQLGSAPAPSVVEHVNPASAVTIAVVADVDVAEECTTQQRGRWRRTTCSGTPCPSKLGTERTQRSLSANDCGSKCTRATGGRLSAASQMRRGLRNTAAPWAAVVEAAAPSMGPSLLATGLQHHCCHHPGPAASPTASPWSR
mmetsp:Transcript_5251/g.12937  ORF Transcript_5251/g.12937 Transcript_5251/m.12937 type:complete len:229 (+) Transcript_5251:629-1315(+)